MNNNIKPEQAACYDMVSVIVPIYNPGPEALRRCLDSVIHQSYPSLEIILINDGSTDGSDSVCKEFASKDNRIIYINQENAGVSAARNKGIDVSTGEYLCFVDSDDYADPDYVQSMVDAVSEFHADIIIQGLKQIKDGQLLKTDAFESGTFPVSSLTDMQFDRIFYYCGPYCKLFKTSIVKSQNLYFPGDLTYGEDAVFYHAYLGSCKNIELLSSTFYNYTVANQGALSTRTLSPDKFWQNQSNRRGAYRNLKEIFGLSQEPSESERACKLTGIGGMLSAIFKSGANDSAVRHYLDTMAGDTNFRLSEIRDTGIYHNFILHLIKSNNRLSRWILKQIYK